MCQLMSVHYTTRKGPWITMCPLRSVPICKIFIPLDIIVSVSQKVN